MMHFTEANLAFQPRCYPSLFPNFKYEYGKMKRRLRTPLCPGEFDSKSQSKRTPGVCLTLTPFSAPFLLPEQGEIEVKAGIADSRALGVTNTHAR